MGIVTPAGTTWRILEPFRNSIIVIGGIIIVVVSPFGFFVLFRIIIKIAASA